MGKLKVADDTALVTAYIQSLEPSFAKMMEAVRQTILSVDKEIGEHIKWNAPCFYYTGEMNPYNPKEYKRELVVFNFYKKDYLLLVFPSGAKVNDISGILEGDYKDGRRLVKINDLADLKSKEKALKKVIKEWLKLIEK
jgi:hypothetical protein